MQSAPLFERGRSILREIIAGFLTSDDWAGWHAGSRTGSAHVSPDTQATETKQGGRGGEGAAGGGAGGPAAEGNWHAASGTSGAMVGGTGRGAAEGECEDAEASQSDDIWDGWD